MWTCGDVQRHHHLTATPTLPSSSQCRFAVLAIISRANHTFKLETFTNNHTAHALRLLLVVHSHSYAHLTRTNRVYHDPIRPHTRVCAMNGCILRHASVVFRCVLLFNQRGFVYLDACDTQIASGCAVFRAGRLFSCGVWRARVSTERSLCCGCS